MEIVQSYMLFLMKLFMLLPIVTSYPEGAPPTACTSMIPGHSAPVQTHPSPYMVHTSQNCYKSGDTISVKIYAKDAKLKGFFIQARCGSDNITLYGSFKAANTEQMLVNCFGGSNNAISHYNINRMEMSYTTVNWQPNSNDNKTIFFVATVVQNTSTFWVGLTSDVVSYDSNCTKSGTDKKTSTGVPQGSYWTQDYMEQKLPNSASPAFPNFALLVLLAWMTSVFYA